MSIYDDMQKVAQDVFQEFNQATISWIKMTPGNGPRHNPGAPSETFFVLVGATARGASTKYVLKGLAAGTDTQINMMVDPRFAPEQGDFVEINNGPRLKIMSIMPKPQAGTPVAYTIIARNIG